ncbi:HAD-IA family hydrolase [Candidatus Sumerlaeota bacterium]|nr:HAD-IA family hydrolase [Candidatus Sumerlaeota bacterium]
MKRQKKKALLFDLDDTLWDHQKAQKSAIEDICVHHEIDFLTFYRYYHYFNQEAWNDYANKLVSLDEMRIQRFARSLKSSRIDHLSPHMLSEEYLALYRGRICLVEGAIEALGALRPVFTIGVITNGSLDVQKWKLDCSQLKDYVDFMVTVDDAKCSKPSHAFFEMAFEKSGVHPRDITCIGDNFKDDIVGAIMAGAGRAVWFNPQNHSIPGEFDIQPDFMILRLTELLNVLSIY